MSTTSVNNSTYSATPSNGGNAGSVTIDVTNNAGLIDIVNQYAWKNKIGGNTDEVPYLYLREFTLQWGQVLRNLAGLWDSVKGYLNAPTGSTGGLNDTDFKGDPYGKLYSVTSTGFSYILPYIIKPNSSLMGKTSNDWKTINTQSIAKQAIGGLVGMGSKSLGDLVASAPVSFQHGTGVGVEDIVYFENTGRRAIKISFPLYNTVDVQSAKNNYYFVSLFKLQNLKTRNTITTFTPPKVYQIEMPGVGGFYMPLAYVKELDIESIGTTRLMWDGSYQEFGNAAVGAGHKAGILLPEAYKVNITFEEVVPESANIYMGAIGGDKVQIANTI
jgi:hypothetical protein